jgi:hypothetical protein
MSNTTDAASCSQVIGFFVGVLAFVGLWSYLVMEFLVPALWGPYATMLSAAGPLAVSRGGLLACFFALPAATVTLPVRIAQTQVGRVQLYVLGLAVTLAAIFAYGYYVHHVVFLQGVNSSLNAYAEEAGYPDAESVPEPVRKAFEVSDGQARHGRLTWLPGGWRRVAWPENAPAPRAEAANSR